MPLNFPTPNLGDSTTLTHTVAGITWTWNSTKNVWSSDISPAADGAEVGSLQTVTDNGAVTTNACEFGGGVKVTGGDDASTLQTYDNGLYVRNDDGGIVIAGPSGSTCQNYIGTVTTAGTNATGIRGSFGFGSNYTTVSQFHAVPGSNYLNSGSADKAVGFTADSSIAHPNATAGYGFLSTLTGNDNYNFYAAGSAPNYFAGLTEHAGGVHVKADNLSSTGNNDVFINNNPNASQEYIPVLARFTSGWGDQKYGFYSQLTGASDGFNNIVGNVSHYHTDILSTASFTTLNDSEHICYSANLNLNLAGITNGSGVKAYGFHSDVSTPNGPNGSAYNFYAAGTAPNYFRGNVIIYDRQDPNNAQNRITLGASSAGCAANFYNGSSTPGNTCAVFRRTVGDGRYIIFLNGVDSNCGYIRVNAAGNGTIYGTNSAGTPAFVELGDARNRTFTDFTGNATDTVKLLQPKVNGFNPVQLQAVVASAVTGTENEEEAIGTFADYDGTVLEAEVTEPPAEELEYTEEVETDGVATMVTRTRTWTPSGTRPVYQGVDQTKLIPLLTKALQEALDRIEQLESNTLQPLYATEADLPSATDHHGKTAHVHATGSLYFAHAGNWVKLQNA